MYKKQKLKKDINCQTKMAFEIMSIVNGTAALIFTPGWSRNLPALGEAALI